MSYGLPVEIEKAAGPKSSTVVPCEVVEPPRSPKIENALSVIETAAAGKKTYRKKGKKSGKASSTGLIILLWFDSTSTCGNVHVRFFEKVGQYLK